MNIKKLILPDSLMDELTVHANNVLNEPNKYAYGSQLIYPCMECDDIFDPTIPGLSTEFIQSWNLTNTRWGSIELETNKCKKLSKVAFPPFETSVKLIEYLEEVTGKQLIKPTGNFLYPVGGYMGWHTNSNMPGYRIYLVYSPEQYSTYFKYIDQDTKEVTVDWDDKGWTARLFKIDDHPDRFFWHAVHAIHQPRISYGYWFR